MTCKPLPVVEPIRPNWNWDRYNALSAERNRRRKAIQRLYPGASFRTGHGGFFWDRNQPIYVLVVIHNDDSRGTHVDQEMTLLERAMDVEMQLTVDTWTPDPNSAVVHNNTAMRTLVMCACDDELWARDDVQDAYARMFDKKPLDRMVEALNEKG